MFARGCGGRVLVMGGGIAQRTRRQRRPRRRHGRSTSASTIPIADPEQRPGDVVDDVGDVAGPVDAGQLELGELDADGVRREQHARRSAPAATAERQRAATTTSSAPEGTNSSVLSSRWPLSKIQNPSGAGPPMSVEQVVSRPSAGTMPGRAVRGDQRDAGDHQQRPEQPGERERRDRPQRAAQGEAEQERTAPPRRRRRAASRPHHRPGTRAEATEHPAPPVAAPRPARPASVTMGSTPRPAGTEPREGGERRGRAVRDPEPRAPLDRRPGGRGAAPRGLRRRAGVGHALREVALAETLGVSRQTVREALTLLVAEGLAVREPHRGVAVSSPDPDSVRDVCRARAVLEGAGVRRWPVAGEERRAHVRACLDAYISAVRAGAAYEQLNERHLAFHVSLVALTGSPRLVRMAGQLVVRAEAGAGPGRPDPAQRARPGRLAPAAACGCSRAATTTAPRTTWPGTSPRPRPTSWTPSTWAEPPAHRVARRRLSGWRHALPDLVGHVRRRAGRRGLAARRHLLHRRHLRLRRGQRQAGPAAGRRGRSSA